MLLLLAQQAAGGSGICFNSPCSRVLGSGTLCMDTFDACLLGGLKQKSNPELQEPQCFIIGSLQRETLSLLYTTESAPALCFQGYLLYRHPRKDSLEKKIFSASTWKKCMKLYGDSSPLRWRGSVSMFLMPPAPIFTATTLSPIVSWVLGPPSHPTDHSALFLLAQLCASPINFL